MGGQEGSAPFVGIFCKAVTSTTLPVNSLSIPRVAREPLIGTDDLVLSLDLDCKRDCTEEEQKAFSLGTYPRTCISPELSHHSRGQQTGMERVPCCNSKHFAKLIKHQGRQKWEDSTLLEVTMGSILLEPNYLANN